MSIPFDLRPTLLFAPIMPVVESPRLQAILMITGDEDDEEGSTETIFFFSP